MLTERAHYVAAHPWLWRLGWFPWQLTAFSDLLLGVALLWTPWIPKLPAVLTLFVTVCAIVPDQMGQALWITRGIVIARDAVAASDYTAYGQFEAVTFRSIAGFATIGYLLGALGWTCFKKAGTWNRQLSWLSVCVWTLFALATACVLLPFQWRPSPVLTSIGNAPAFILLMLWLWRVAEEVWSRSRPAANHGRYAEWTHPNSGWTGTLFNLFASSHLVREFGSFVPIVPFTSHITEVIYINYLVPADRCLSLTPSGLEFATARPRQFRALYLPHLQARSFRPEFFR
jgi:hypothetical protein